MLEDVLSLCSAVPRHSGLVCVLLFALVWCCSLRLTTWLCCPHRRSPTFSPSSCDGTSSMWLLFMLSRLIIFCSFSWMVADNLDNWPGKGEECACSSHKLGNYNWRHEGLWAILMLSSPGKYKAGEKSSQLQVLVRATGSWSCSKHALLAIWNNSTGLIVCGKHPVKSQLDSSLVEAWVKALPLISIMPETCPGICHLVSNTPPMALLTGNVQEISPLQADVASSGLQGPSTRIVKTTVC